MLFWGIYEGAERRFVQKYLDRDLPVVELGSSDRRDLEPYRPVPCCRAAADLR